MAVKTWINEGKTFYQIDVCVRSKKGRAMRVQKRESGSFEETDSDLVQKKLDRIESKLVDEATRELMIKESSGMTWGNLVGEYIAALKEDLEESIKNPAQFSNSKPLSSMTANSYIQSLEDFTLDCWGERFSKDITPGDVEDLFKRMKKQGYSNCRMYNVKVAISRCYQWGIKRHKIPGATVSPTLGFGISRKQSKRPEILNLKQIEFLFSEADRLKHDWRYIWKSVYYCGARSGEQYQLKAKHIDFVDKMQIFEEKYNFGNHEVEPLKDHEWRQVPINRDLYDLYAELGVHEMDPEQHVFPRMTSWKNGEAARILRAFCEKIGIPSICFHTLRACWATQLIKNGVSQLQVMAMGGWSDLETMSRYIRLAGLEVAGATDSLNLKRERPARVLKLIQGAQESANVTSEEAELDRI